MHFIRTVLSDNAVIGNTTVMPYATKERETYVLNLFNGVCHLACMRRHWSTNEVFIDAMNHQYKPSPEVKKEEMKRIIKKHPQYNAISSGENKLGLDLHHEEAQGEERRDFGGWGG